VTIGALALAVSAGAANLPSGFVETLVASGLVNPTAMSSAATDGGDLSVTPAAALDRTTRGLAALVDDTSSLFVVDGTGNDENQYRARFYLDPNGFDPGQSANHFRTRILIALEENPLRRLITLVLRKLADQYSIQARIALDDGTRAETGFVDISDAPHAVEIDWHRSSSPAASDGSFELWIDGSSVATLDNLDNRQSAVDLVRLGALTVKTAAAGTLYFDEFVSGRRDLIGP
jgi:hypothetical protein